MSNEMNLSQRRIDELIRAEKKLTALEAGGVDNWDGYSFALEEWHKENALEELVSKYAENIFELAAEAAQVEEPSERGAGWAVMFNDDVDARLRAILLSMIEEYQNENCG